MTFFSWREVWMGGDTCWPPPPPLSPPPLSSLLTTEYCSLVYCHYYGVLPPGISWEIDDVATETSYLLLRGTFVKRHPPPQSSEYGVPLLTILQKKEVY